MDWYVMCITYTMFNVSCGVWHSLTRVSVYLSISLYQRRWGLDMPRAYSHCRHELANYNFAAILPGDSVAGLVAANGVLNFLNIYNTLLVVRLILTWFPQPPQIIANPLRCLYTYFFSIWRKQFLFCCLYITYIYTYIDIYGGNLTVFTLFL